MTKAGQAIRAIETGHLRWWNMLKRKGVWRDPHTVEMGNGNTPPPAVRGLLYSLICLWRNMTGRAPDCSSEGLTVRSMRSKRLFEVNKPDKNDAIRCGGKSGRI